MGVFCCLFVEDRHCLLFCLWCLVLRVVFLVVCGCRVLFVACCCCLLLVVVCGRLL